MRILLITLMLALVAACSGTPKPKMFPPNASIQELRVLPDGQWEVALRVQNQARMNIRVSQLALTLRVGNQEAGRVELPLDLAIPSTSAERVMLTLSPSASAADAVNLALSEGRSVAYRLTGQVRTTEPDRRNDPVEFDSRLSPAPGLPGTLR